METIKNNLVSIGLPVFNGEKKLSYALDLLIAQDYPQIEIIISDNGSTDRTQDICQKYLIKDPRIKYFRVEKNLGTIWNFNRVFTLSSGNYFMWAADDDWHEQSFISACVRELEKFPEAALCHCHTELYIEGKDELLCTNVLSSYDGCSSLADRYRETLRNFPATAIYGVYRSESMKKTKLFQKCIATDLAFIQELSLYGNFIQVNKVHFRYYGRKKWNTIHQDYKVFFGKDRKPIWYIPFIALFFNNCSRLINSSFKLSLKQKILWILVAHELRQILIKILIKLIKLLCIESLREKIGYTIYWWCIHSPNVIVGNKDLFIERVVRPKLGWE